MSTERIPNPEEELLSELSPDLAEAILKWLDYKAGRGKAHPLIARKMIIQEAKRRAEAVGEAVVIAEMARSRKRGWMGWDFSKGRPGKSRL